MLPLQANNYSITIAGTTVTDANKTDVLGDGKISYDPLTNTLTLNNATIQATGQSAIVNTDMSTTFHIVLKGTNNYISMSNVSDYNGAIHTMGRLIITSEERPSQIAELKVVTNGAPIIWSYTGDIFFENPIKLTFLGAGSGAGSIYSQTNGNLYIDGATVSMLPCRIRMNTTTIARSSITSPSDATIDSDSRIIRSGTTTEYSNQTAVVITSKLQKVFYGADPKNKGNQMQIQNYPATEGQTFDWFQTGEDLVLTAVPAGGYEFFAWYYVDTNGQTHTISDENPITYTITASSSVIYAKFDHTTDLTFGVIPRYAGNIVLCNDLPTDSLTTVQYSQLNSLTFKAIAGYGYNFTGWYRNEDSTPFSTNNPVTIMKSNEDENIWANFERDETVVNRELTGVFSVGQNKRVRFSPGNLQYQPFTHIFLFADHQYTTIGYDNKDICDNSLEWFDLFGWGTGNNPALATKDQTDYSTYSEWGDNPIINAENTAYQWRTLTENEWIYLISGRPDSDKKWGKAIIDGKAGLILLPDDFADLSYIRSSNSNFSENSYTEANWNWMEQQGAVFLPVTGYRNGTDIYQAQSIGRYWSSTPEETHISNYFTFIENNLGYSTGSNYIGMGVRLVQDLQEQALDPFHQEEVSQTKKFIKNGQLLIERGDKTFNVLGTEIK